MNEDSFSSASRLPQPQAKTQPLTESNGNSMRQASMAPPESKGIKRGLPQPSNIGRPGTKAAKHELKGRSILEVNNHTSNIARPASAASRHGPAKSTDISAFKSRIGTGFVSTGNHSLRRPQTAKGRLASGGGESTEPQGKGSSDVTMSSRVSSLSSCASSFSSYFDAVDQSVRSSSMSSTSTLVKGIADLRLTSDAVNSCVTPRRQSQIPRHRLERLPKMPSLQSIKPQKRQSPEKSPQRSLVKNQGFYPNKESNHKITTGFDVKEKLSTMEGMFKQWTETFTQGSQEQQTMSAAMEVYKSRVDELDKLRERLERTNSNLQQDLLDVKSALSYAQLQQDGMRRDHYNELDEIKRRSRDESDEIRRKYNDELDEFRRARRESREYASAASQDEIQLLERKQRAELDDLRREMSWAIDEEKRERKREVQALQLEAEAAMRNVETGVEKHNRELEDKDERIAQFSRQVEREREIADDLRKQLSRTMEQGDEFENAARSLKARVEFLQSDNQSQSQAFADLEQRTQDALKETEEYKNQLRREETIRRKLLNQIQDLKGNIRVFCRVRPPLPHEQGSCASIDLPDANTDAKELQVRGPQEISSLGKDMTKTHPFSFDRAFGPSSENAEIFTELSELVAAVCGGSFNTCIFSYGQTGSGKTYTMASADGMISRAVGQIFDTGRSLVEKGWLYQVSGSFVEVYNENINDLLGRPEDFDKKKREIRHDMQKLTTTITDVIETPLNSAEHFGTVLDQALRNRSIAATKANERSSRSHSVCILRIEGQNHITGETCSSTLNLVDLAGSERLAHSQATGAQLKETQNINKSLSCLKDVIAALGDAKDGSHVPYRNSKLTYLLQNSLGGNSKTLMFVMISPLQEHLSETLSSLNFATKVNNTRIIKKGKK